MIGETLGRYRIIERLGQGGMGTVYRAHDPRLDREVALKVLREDALRDEPGRRRFRQEARALSRLLHPHIATLFDLDSAGDVDYLVLEYVPGDTLATTLAAGPLPENRARAIAIQVGEALELAHEQGVVHRDLKPGNIIITPRGHAKVLDFGLAHFLPGAAAVTQVSTVASSHSLTGTMPYMAPEQVSSDVVDARTDLHALGHLLYEMTTGSRAFAGADLAAMLYQIVHEPPRPVRELRPGLSEELELIVARCMEKSPARRPSDAAALVRALKGESSSGLRSGPPPGPETATPGAGAQSPPIRSLVVLPFENRSGDVAQEFFADGMTDSLIANLSRIGALRVISRTSAMRFKGTQKALAEVAHELKVDAVVEGSAMRAGERVRITVSLVDAAADRTLWGESYERAFTDILSLQSDVTRAIAEEIRIQVTPDERDRMRARGPVNPVAHVAYLEGRFMWNRYTPDALHKSIAHYEAALAADPGYAVAYAGLADSYALLAATNALPPGEGYELARRAALKGLALDDGSAELHTSLAFVLRFYDWNWAGAEAEFLRAIELNPGYATTRRWYAQHLSGLGRHEEAIAEAERALQFDPLSLVIHTTVGDVNFYARRYERAVGYYQRCQELDSSFPPGHTDMARALEHLGRVEEALAEFVLGVPSHDGRPQPSTGLAILQWRAGRSDEAEATLARVLEMERKQYVSPYGIASYYAIAGESERALEWLETAYGRRDSAMVWINVHPRLDSLRGEPRFRELLRRMRLDS